MEGMCAPILSFTSALYGVVTVHDRSFAERMCRLQRSPQTILLEKLIWFTDHRRGPESVAAESFVTACGTPEVSRTNEIGDNPERPNGHSDQLDGQLLTHQEGHADHPVELNCHPDDHLDDPHVHPDDSDDHLVDYPVELHNTPNGHPDVSDDHLDEPKELRNYGGSSEPTHGRPRLQEQELNNSILRLIERKQMTLDAWTDICQQYERGEVPISDMRAVRDVCKESLRQL